MQLHYQLVNVGEFQFGACPFDKRKPDKLVIYVRICLLYTSGEYYNTIASCNALLERVDNITLENASEEKDKAAIISEAKALKALCYFNLLRLFAPAYDKNPQADGIVSVSYTHLDIA